VSTGSSYHGGRQTRAVTFHSKGSTPFLKNPLSDAKRSHWR
jgi:hypothetical protein